VEVWVLAERLRLRGVRRGVSPVVSVIILSAIVIAIGGALWNYSQGAATVIANDYINGTMSLLKEVIERFSVEHASNSSNGGTLHVWVYNYGDVDIIVDVYANATHYVNSTYSLISCSSNMSNSVVSMGLMKINISFAGNPLQRGDSVALKVHSRRQNNAFYKYTVQ
jgi:flagellin-like protein